MRCYAIKTLFYNNIFLYTSTLQYRNNSFKNKEMHISGSFVPVEQFYILLEDMVLCIIY